MSAGAPPRRPAPAIATRGLSRRFGSAWAVRDLDIDVPAGSVTGLIGPNGSGKTTTLKLLIGLIRPTRGEVQVDGRVVRGGPHALPVRLRALLDPPAFYGGLTAHENLLLLSRLSGPPEPSPGDVDRALDAMGLAAHRDRRADGLSTGLRKRVGLALCLLGEPQLVLLDEPTSGLDPEHVVGVRRVLAGLAAARRATVVVSSHHLPVLEEVADHLVLIREGSVVAQGPRSRLLAPRERARFLLRAEPEAAARESLAAIAAIAAIATPEPHIVQDAGGGGGGGGIRFEADRRDVPDLVARLVAGRVRIFELREEKATLEEFYMMTTAPAAGGDAREPGR
jgi:ABC-2 type transport system ATP-binding protein